MRINARLDTVYNNRLKCIQQLTHEKVTEIIKHSIDLYYQKMSAEQAQTSKKLLKSRLVGCAEGETSLSENYKALLTQGLFHKHDHR